MHEYAQDNGRTVVIKIKLINQFMWLIIVN